MIKLPLLDSKSRGNYYPNDDADTSGVCPVCGASFRVTGFAEICCDTSLRNKKGYSWFGDSRLPEGVRQHISLEVGFANDDDVSPTTSQNKSSQNLKSNNEHDKIHEIVYIVKDLVNDSFSITFCSIRCMRNFFNAVLDDFSEDFCDKHGFDP
jgi:hypothetical protein